MRKPDKPKDGWEGATHEGSRRFQLRRARELTLRERLEAVERMSELSDRLRRYPEVRGRVERRLDQP
ncbi:hypothetical protein BH20GEM1_BH20GEM1_12150 [soil metagenome]